VKRFVVGWAVGVLALAASVPGAGAVGGGACRITGRILFTPNGTGGGWSIERGIIDCQGLLAGGKNRVVGPGELRAAGTYTTAPGPGGACVHQIATGTFDYQIPTSGGFVVINEKGGYTLVGVGALTTPTLRGTAQVAPPYTGDCVTKPVTVATFLAQVTLYRGVGPGL
jgi:hypothetical protein